MKSTRNDGGPAFPCIPPDPNPNAYSQFPVGIGMTLRDYFAGQALAGELAAQSGDTGEYNTSQESTTGLATRCYIFADAMIAAREARQ